MRWQYGSSTANRPFLHAVPGAPLMVISYINQEAGCKWAGEGPRLLVYLQGTPRLAGQHSESSAARPVNPRLTHSPAGFAVLPQQTNGHYCG